MKTQDAGGYCTNPKVKPSDALDHLLRKPKKYRFECHTFSSLVFLLAIRDFLGTRAFNRVYKNRGLVVGEKTSFAAMVAPFFRFVVQEEGKMTKDTGRHIQRGDHIYLVKPPGAEDLGANLFVEGVKPLRVRSQRRGLQPFGNLVRDVNALVPGQKSAWLLNYVGRLDPAKLQRFANQGSLPRAW